MTYVNQQSIQPQTGSADAKGFVTTRFDSASAYAEASFDQVSLYVNELNAILNSLEVPSIDNIADINLSEIAPINYAGLPTPDSLSTHFSITGTAPTAPTLDTISDINTSGIPSENFNFTPNTITMPALATIAAPGDSPGLSSVSIPAAPDKTLPDPFVANTITLPSVPKFETISFSISAPTLDVLNTPDGFSYSEEPYNSSIWTDLLGKILSDIRNGGTGLDAAVEADIYARGILRQVTENDRLYRQVLDVHGSSGFNLPTGALAANITEVLSDISRKNDLINHEITIQQAELAQKNTQFALTIGTDLEKMLRDFFTSQSNRALEAAKATAQTGIEIFNTLVAKYNAQLENYRTEAAVFETRIRAEALKAEQYKAQIEGSQVEANIQRIQAEVYQHQVAAVETQAKIYGIEMESAKIQSQIEFQKIESFRATVESYVAKLQGEKLKVDLYNAELEGENVKAKIYSEQVNAYAVKVDAETKKVSLNIQEQQLKIDNNKNLIEEYKAKLDNHQKAYENALRQIEVKYEGYNSQMMGYTAQTDALKAQNLTKIEEYKANIEHSRMALAKGIAEVKATLDGYTSLQDLKIKGTDGIMQVSAQLAAAAMGSVNATASLGFSGGESLSASHNQGLSESHAYNETP